MRRPAATGTSVWISSGAVDDQNYWNTGTSTSTDDFQYAYDQNSNALYKNIVGQGASGSAYSQLYHVNSSGSGDDATAYDNLDRLQAYEQGALTASGNNGSSVLDTVNTNTASGAWTLDALGNWTSVTTNGTPASRSFNAQNQITGSTITYDGDGNMTQDDRGITYTYDGWNHLVSETSGSTVGKYAYDGLGRRISDTQITASGSAITFSFFTQAWQVAEDYTATVNASGSVTWGAKYRYIYGPGSSTSLTAGGVNDLVARDDSAGNRLYVQMDANDDVTALVGKVGSAWQVVERFVYTPYGKLSATLNGNWTTGGGNYNWVYLWQMGRYDSLSGLTNFRNRDYSPTLGRWMEKDPTGANYIDGGNLYQAMDGNPAGMSDPLGLDPTAGMINLGNGLYGDTYQDPSNPSVTYVHVYAYTTSWFGLGENMQYIGRAVYDGSGQNMYDGAINEYGGIRSEGICNAASQIEITASNVANVANAYMTATMIADGTELAVFLAKQGYKLAAKAAGKYVLSKAGSELSEAEMKDVFQQATKDLTEDDPCPANGGSCFAAGTSVLISEMRDCQIAGVSQMMSEPAAQRPAAYILAGFVGYYVLNERKKWRIARHGKRLLDDIEPVLMPLSAKRRNPDR